MDKQNLVEKLIKQFTSSEKAKDYTFLTFFFIIFSVFIVAAIRPALITAFSLKKEEQDLMQLDQQYEQAISTVVADQAALENSRDKLVYLDEAFPSTPALNQLIKEIQDQSSATSTPIESISVADVNLVDSNNQTIKEVAIVLESSASFDNVQKFVDAILNQRRLKQIKSLNIVNSKTGSNSAGLKVTLEVAASYL